MDPAFDNMASSLRFSGAPDGILYDTINLYEAHYFMGREQFFYDDAPQFDMGSFGSSIVVTGCSPWTIYQYDNYQGAALCLYPSDTTDCDPSFFPTPDDLGGLADQISSAKKGCLTNSVIYGKSIPEGKFVSSHQ